MKLQKLGGYACIVMILLLVIVYGLAPILGFKAISENTDPAESINIFNNYPLFYRIFLQITSISFAIFYIVFAMALHERMHLKAPNLMNFAIIAASITAATQFFGSIINNSLMEAMVKFQDHSPLIVSRSIKASIGSASTHSFGWVVLLIGIAAIRTHMLPKVLGYLILIWGFGGVLIFAVKQVGIIIMLLMPIVLIWLGIYLIRNPGPAIE